MPGCEVGGVGVQSLTSSLESTLSGSNGTRPAPAKPPWIFLSVMEVKEGETCYSVYRGASPTILAHFFLLLSLPLLGVLGATFNLYSVLRPRKGSRTLLVNHYTNQCFTRFCHC